ncbi:MAG: SGNH/GDSL hydrolase family protein [Woeseia sp.]
MSMKSNVHRYGWRVVLILAVLATGACDSDSSGSGADVHYYVSLGTSLSVGVQPNAGGTLGLTNEGYPDQLFTIIKPTFDAAGPPTRELQHVSFGCPGETMDTMMNGGICPYIEGSQLDAAVAFLTANPGQVHLVTIDMGANDVLDGGCIGPPAVDFNCINGVVTQIATNLPVILTALRNAAGPGTPIVGMNYYNPFLSSWLLDVAGQVLAMDSATAIGTVNNEIGLSYTTAQMPVADVAAAFQSDDFVTMVSSSLPPPNDVLPVNVANICSMTYMCDLPPVGPDVHANAAGYGLIADTFAAVLP